jgi:opacity protein-like surface antigen
MVFRQKMCLPAVTAVLAATAAVPTLAATGLYVGATAGGSLFHQNNKSDLDAAIVEGFNSLHYSTQIASSSLDRTSHAFGALVGYRLMPGFSIEAGYTDLGNLTYKSSGTLALTINPGISATETANVKTGAKGPTLAALGILPITTDLEIYGRAGLFFSKVTVDPYTTSIHVGPGVNAQAIGSASANSVDPLFSAGAGWHVVDHVTLRAEYTRFVNVGDKDKIGEMNIDVFNVGVTYSFN